MGGFMFIIGIFLACAVCIPMMYISAPENSNELLLRNQTLTKAVGGPFDALGFGAIGFLDDYIKVVKKRNLGLNEKQKLGSAVSCSSRVSGSPVSFGGPRCYENSFLGSVDLGIIFWIISFLGIVGIVNAVNFTDVWMVSTHRLPFGVCVALMLISGWWKIYNISLLAAAGGGGCVGLPGLEFQPRKSLYGRYRLPFPGRNGLRVSFWHRYADSYSCGRNNLYR